MSDWRPSGGVEALKLRAKLLARARGFFAERNILEVETPLLGLHTVTEPGIDSIEVRLRAVQRYLQTSPEYAMKRLLAAGVGDCYQICKAFRCGEEGKHHNPEFTLIEWYRSGFDLQKIIHEAVALLAGLLADASLSERVQLISYSQAFEKVVGKTLHDLSAQQIKALAIQQGLRHTQDLGVDQYLDFIVANHIVAGLCGPLTVIYHYPAAQAALAKLNANDANLAERFEIFYQGVELANGCCELIDAQAQQTRFQSNQATRRARGLAPVAIDQRLIAAQRHGLPECAGVALGLDRVLMLALGVANISAALSFDWPRA